MVPTTGKYPGAPNQLISLGGTNLITGREKRGKCKGKRRKDQRQKGKLKYFSKVLAKGQK
jgi:hypothetical protein